MDECASHCADRNGHLQPNLTDIREVKLPKLGHIRKSDYVCGRCSCVCPEYLNQEECKPVHHSHFGFSTSTKIAIGVLTGLAVMFIIIAVAMCCFDSACCAISGLLTGTTTILLLTCTMPILVVYSNNFEATTLKRNNLLIATLVPLAMTIIGLIVTCLLRIYTDTKGREAKYRFFTIWFTVLAISIPVGLEYGLRFSNVPPSCHNSTDEYCSPYSGMHTPTKILLGVIGLTVSMIIGVAFWFNRVRGSCNWCISEGNIDEQWRTPNIFYTQQSAINTNNTSRDITNGFDDYSNYSEDSFDWPPTGYPNPVNPHNVHGYPGEIITRYDEAYPSEDYYQTITDGIITESSTEYLEPINEQTHNMEQRNETGQRGMCAICMEQQASMLMRPCKHVCLCPECWNQYKSDNDSCPICRRRLDMGRVERIYLSWMRSNNRYFPHRNYCLKFLVRSGLPKSVTNKKWRAYSVYKLHRWSQK